MINKSNDVVSCKGCAFWGSENKILHLDPIFTQKTQIFRQFSTGLEKLCVKKALTKVMLPCKLP